MSPWARVHVNFEPRVVSHLGGLAASSDARRLSVGTVAEVVGRAECLVLELSQAGGSGRSKASRVCRDWCVVLCSSPHGLGSSSMLVSPRFGSSPRWGCCSSDCLIRRLERDPNRLRGEACCCVDVARFRRGRAVGFGDLVVVGAAVELREGGGWVDVGVGNGSCQRHGVRSGDG